jgi:hypothetical protein
VVSVRPFSHRADIGTLRSAQGETRDQMLHFPPFKRMPNAASCSVSGI